MIENHRATTDEGGPSYEDMPSDGGDPPDLPDD